MKPREPRSLSVFLRLSPRQLFLVDGAGALLTATLLGIVLVPFAEYFGMPERIFEILAAVALAYGVYSCTLALIDPIRWRVWVQIIAAANLAYCGLTLTLIVILRDGVTGLGAAYFIAEAVLIAALAAFEWRYASLRN